MEGSEKEGRRKREGRGGREGEGESKQVKAHARPEPSTCGLSEMHQVHWEENDKHRFSVSDTKACVSNTNYPSVSV